MDEINGEVIFMKSIKDITTYQQEMKISFSFGHLFQDLSEYQEAFSNKIRWQVENELFDDWEGCDGATGDGTVEYYDVLFNDKRYENLKVNYYYGKIYADKTYDLHFTLKATSALG